ncbi:unnamed protein product [Urochloa humidicola]
MSAGGRSGRQPGRLQRAGQPHPVSPDDPSRVRRVPTALRRRTGSVMMRSGGTTIVIFRGELSRGTMC